ncbi:MAG: cation-translocating P-type ATPase [Vicinamibacterales bacterium]
MGIAPTGTSPTGLTTIEAGRRLRRDGPNALPASGPRPLLLMMVDVLREPMLLLLVATGGIYLVLGDPLEAAAMGAAVSVVIGISLVQARRTERTLHALRTLSSPQARVLRDGEVVRLPGADLVRGDVILLAEGDRVPADATLQESVGLSADESMLTGESASVAKAAAEEVYSGTMVVAGHGVAEVTRIGAGTELGRIGRSLANVQIGKTPLQAEVAITVRLLAVIGLLACLVIVVLFGLREGSWLAGLLAGLTLAISMVPEEFPVILTVFLALGAWRISRSHVLTRRFPAIEALGAATTLCVDKTGTLTMNRMSIAGLDVEGVFTPFDGSVQTSAQRGLLGWAALASAARAVDPMDIACHRAGEGHPPARPWTLEHEYPLTPGRWFVAQGWRNDEGAQVIAAKGAPEAIVRLCRLPASGAAATLERVTRMAEQGLRVLAVAHATIRGDWPADVDGTPFTFDGLVGFADPVRPTVPAAIRDCRAAGVRVVMLTGDYPQTAAAVARAIDLDRSGGVLTGSDIASMDDAALAIAARQCQVFARVVPEQKLRLVRALQATGQVVAMTGDGVNDAPALKAADIGIAMGLRGTDVAREAAALVLLDDDFASIVGAVRLGRRIYDNIRKATGYVLAVHVPIAGISLLPPLLGWPLVLLPLHVVFMELIVDPACSVAFEMEPEEGNVMARPPRSRGARLFDRALVTRSLLQGTGMLAVVFAVNAWAVAGGASASDGRMLAFSTLILSNLILLLANRSRVPFRWALAAANPALWAIVSATLAALAAVLYVPGLQSVFTLAEPHGEDLLLCLGAALVVLVWMEFTKRPRKHACLS